MMGAVFKTVGEIVRAVLGWFDSDTPPPKFILDLGFRIADFLFLRGDSIYDARGNENAHQTVCFARD